MARIKSAIETIGVILALLGIFIGFAFFDAVIQTIKIIFMVLIIYAFDLVDWLLALFS